MAPVAELEQINEALAKSRAQAQAKWAAFTKGRAEAQDEAKKAGVDVVTYLRPDAENGYFGKMDDLHKEYSAAAQEVATYEDMLVKVAGWDLKGPGLDPSLEGSAAAAFANPGNIRSFGDPFVASADRFLNSEAYKAAIPSIKDWTPGSKVQMDPVEIMTREQFKATLVTGASNTSGGAMVFDQIIQGLTVDLPFRPTRILGLVGKSTTDSDAIDYVEQTSRTNAAAETAESTDTTDGALPESATAFVVRVVNVIALGHWLPVTNRALADAGQLRGILENELRTGVEVRLDGQLLNGNGTAPNLKGILNTSGIGTQALGSDSRSDAIHKAITVIEVAATINDSLTADAVALHNNDWQSVRLEKDRNGNYIYGPPSQEGPLTMWGRPVVKSLAFSAGTGLVGAFDQASRLWIRSGVTLAATDSHSDFFTKDILAIKATMRVAFAVLRPAAFTQVTGL